MRTIFPGTLDPVDFVNNTDRMCVASHQQGHRQNTSM